MELQNLTHMLELMLYRYHRLQEVVLLVQCVHHLTVHHHHAHHVLTHRALIHLAHAPVLVHVPAREVAGQDAAQRTSIIPI